MNSSDEQFQAECVEEQISQLGQMTPQPAGDMSSNARLITDLRQISTDYTQAGARVWSRLAERLAQQNAAPHSDTLTSEKNPLERSFPPMQTDQRILQATSRRKPQRVFALVASLVAAAVLVGLMAAILTLRTNHQGTTVTTPKTATATPTVAPLPIGSIVYTRTSDADTSISPFVAWSPDSKRIASLVIKLHVPAVQLQIWDATTGGNLLTVPLADGYLNQVYWSPTGKYLAVDDLQTIVIVDSQTGTIVNTIHLSSIVAARPPITQQPLFASFIPAAGGVGFYAVAWTPDGTLLAVAVSDTTFGKIELINPVTSVVNVTFSAGASTIATALAFSTDGQYLAVSYPDSARVVVWQVSTRAVVFQQNDAQAEMIAWQPGTHNLARTVFFPAALQLWDVSSHQLLKTYAGITSFAWSPDGKALATYTSTIDSFRQAGPPKTTPTKVSIIDAQSGTQIALFISQQPFINLVLWSPDGRYLASVESSLTRTSSNRIFVRVA